MTQKAIQVNGEHAMQTTDDVFARLAEIEKPPEDSTPEEKRAWRVRRWREAAVPFVSSEAQAEYEARIDRVMAAINLEEPDRVPVSLNAGFWPARIAGLTPYEAMNNPYEAGAAWVSFNQRFEPDVMCSPVNHAVPASVFESLDYRLYSWPGHGSAKETGYQFNEKEWMLPDEYDHLISDPSDYMLRTYLPRAVGGFAGFSSLSSLFDFIELPFVSGHIGSWGSPEVLAGLERLIGAARKRNDWWTQAALPAIESIKALGFPPYATSMAKAPFDILGDTLRGTKGIMLDMFRRPEKIRAACERLVDVAVNWVLRRATPPATPVTMFILHKGADGFMSDEHFRTLYWPTLREVILRLVDEGMIPLLFAEGHYESRLRTVMDLPKGGTIWLFDQTDMAQAKRTVGTVACVQGNVPLSLIHAGTADQVRDYTRRLIETAGDGGGYILDFGAAADGGKEQNLTTMLNTAREYGVY